MRAQEDRAAWEDAYNATQRRRVSNTQQEPGWYTMAGSIAAGLVALWALFTWLPSG